VSKSWQVDSSVLPYDITIKSNQGLNLKQKKIIGEGIPKATEVTPEMGQWAVERIYGTSVVLFFIYCLYTFASDYPPTSFCFHAVCMFVCP